LAGVTIMKSWVQPDLRVSIAAAQPASADPS
jgi:hypothetical protein